MNNKQIGEDEINTIKELLSSNLSYLYSLIPEYDPEMQDLLFTPEEKEEKGRKIFADLHSKLFQHVCVEYEMCKKLDDPAFQDPVYLVTALADVISSLTIGIPPFLMATILVRIGLRDFCKC